MAVGSRQTVGRRTGQDDGAQFRPPPTSPLPSTAPLPPFLYDLKSGPLYVTHGNVQDLALVLADACLIGVDTETQPSRDRRQPTSLLQLAVRRRRTGEEAVAIVDLLDVAAAAEAEAEAEAETDPSMSCSSSLAALNTLLAPVLRNGAVIKVGHGLQQDFAELYRAYPALTAFKKVHAVADTNTIYRTLHPDVVNDVSLKNLAREFLQRDLSKTLQLSDWGERPLSAAQVRYAACDALVLLRLHDAMVQQAAATVAAASGEHDLVPLLSMEEGGPTPRLDDADRPRKRDATPLLMAAQTGHLALVKFLLEMGADKDEANVHGATALFMAAKNGHLMVVRCLLEQGAEKDRAANSGSSPLCMAAKNGHAAVVRYLVEQGADKDKAANNGVTALFVASQKGYEAVVRNLVEHGADKNKPNKGGETPVYMAAKKGHLAVVQYLLEKGANKDVAKDRGATPLHMAAQGGHVAVVRCLVEQGADMNRAKIDGRTPLFIAAQKGQLAVVEYLVTSGADKNKAANDGRTPLYIAAKKGHLPVVEYLVEHGAEKNKAKYSGVTPLQVARIAGHAEVVAYLRAAGAT